MKKVSKNTKLIEGIMFYTFAQNNSGGCFDVDDGSRSFKRFQVSVKIVVYFFSRLDIMITSAVQ